jgi:uncharacterized protein (DUF4415 family)
MRKKGTIVSATAEEIQAMVARGESRSDWEASQRMSQEEVERLADEDDGPLPEGWESTVMIGLPPRKEPVHIRLDADVLAWFRAHGRGYQTRINAVLRSFVQARQSAETKEPHSR